MTKNIDGLQKFIEYKRNVETERRLLTVDSHLITIDGVDGSGKSSIARKLVKKLQERFGENNVILADITNFRGSDKQERLGVLSKQGGGCSLDMLYAAGVNRAYADVIVPALKRGAIVVVDRSEVDLLRYAIERSSQDLIKKRIVYIEDGTLTHRLWAGVRIFIESTPSDVLENLKQRKTNSCYDPTSFKEVEASINAQLESEKQVEALPHTGEVKILREQVIRVADESEREKYLDELVDKLFTIICSQKKKDGDK